MTKNIQPKSQTSLYIGSKLSQRCKKNSLSHLLHISLLLPLTFPPPPGSPPAVSAVIDAASERSSLTFDVAQNWISGMILCPSPSPCVSHAVTNWEACQRPGCLNGRRLVKTVCDLCIFFPLSSVSLALSGALLARYTHRRTCIPTRTLVVKVLPVQWY